MAVYLPARLGRMRLGATRLGYFTPTLLVKIDGVDRTANVRVEGVSISDIANEEPSTASFRVSGITPSYGYTVAIYLGDTRTKHLIFGGTILQVQQVYEEIRTNVAYDVQCVDYTWLMNRRKVIKKYTNQSATDIAIDLIQSFSSGYSTDHVEAGLATVNEITFTNEELPTALTRLAARIGATWRMDYTRDLHFSVTDASDVIAIADASLSTTRNLVSASDLSQIVTRVWVRGGGSNALVDVAAGATTIPVEDGAWYYSGGGWLESGPQRIVYTGKSSGDGTGSVTGGLPQSPAAPSAAVNAGVSGDVLGAVRYQVVHESAAGASEPSAASGTVTVATVGTPAAPAATVLVTSGDLSAGARRYKVAFGNTESETLASSASVAATINDVLAPSSDPTTTATTGGSLDASTTYYYFVSYVTADGETSRTLTGSSVTLSSTQNAVSLSNIPISSDARVTARRIYRAKSGSASRRLALTVSNNTATTATDTTAEESLGAEAPLTNTTGWGQVSLTSIPTSGDARVTKRHLYRTTAGGTLYKRLATINDNVTTTYTDNIADADLGAVEPTDAIAFGGAVTVTVPVGASGTVARKLYRTVASGSVYKYLGSIRDNVTTTYSDTKADDTLGEDAPTSSTVHTDAGSTTLRVADISLFSASGGWVTAGSQVLRFSGRSAATGEADLTGIPASGTGSIQAAIKAGTAVVNAPHLTGVSSVSYTIPQGDPVNVLVECNDAAAQTAIALLVGGDGIHEDFLSDGRWSVTECEAQGAARLLSNKDPEQTHTFQTRDVRVHSSKTVTFSLGAPTNVSGTFRVQSVTFSDVGISGALERVHPLRTVTVSANLYTFERLLQNIKGTT